MENETDIRGHWDTIWRSTPIDKVMWEEGAPAAELVKLIESGAVVRGRALDIGTGSGNNTAYLASCGFTTYGIDISPTAIEITRQKLAGASLTCELTNGSAIELPYPDASFDFAFDRGCLPNMELDVREPHLKSVRRVLKSGGKYQFICFSDKDHPDKGPPHPFSPEAIRALFGPLFRIIEIKEFTNLRHGATHYHLSVLMEKA